MHLTITSRHREADDKLKAYIHKRVGRLEKLYGRIYKCEVILNDEKLNKNVEIIMHLKSNRMVARENLGDVYASVDKAAENMKKQLRRLNDKVRSRRRKAVFKTILGAVPSFGMGKDTSGSGDAEIVSSNSFADKPMLPDEARLELNLSNMCFIMFKNADTGEPNVLYKRDDGKCGLIEPKF